MAKHIKCIGLSILVLSILCCKTLTAQSHVFAQLKGSPVNTTGWSFEGAASIGNILGTGDSEIIVCPAQYFITGAVFYNQPVNLSFCNKWIAEFDFRIFDGSLADGLAFCFLDVPPSGFVVGGGMGIPATANGLKVCFDPNPNCFPLNFAIYPKIEMRWGAGYDECWAQPTVDNTTGTLSFIRSNHYNHAKIVYDNGNINVYVNNTLYLTGFQQFNFSGYFGFTAATGAKDDNHSIKNVVIYANIPAADAGKNVLACSGDSAQLGNITDPMLIYSWIPVSGLSSSTISNPKVANSNFTAFPSSTKYYLNASYPGNPGCSSIDSTTVTINPKPIITKDTALCAGSTVPLKAANALTFQWNPATWLNDPTVQNPIVTTTNTNSSITYTLATTNYSNNLVANGDFEQGNTGFVTTYSYCNTNNCLYPISANGYSVGSDANFFHTLFTGHDHTTGKGNFMIINGADPALTVWKETIAVQPNTDYVFGTWISTLITVSPAQIRFSINGVQLGNIFNAPAAVNQWVRYFTTWNSGLNTSATIEIVDVLPVSSGNDFGLDDIFFGQVVSCSDSVKVSVFNPDIKLFPSPSLSICGDSIILDAGAGYTIYQWNTGAKTRQITVKQGGKYIVSASNGACIITDSVLVTLNKIPDLSSAASNSPVCSGNVLKLTAPPFNAALYQWQGPDGFTSDLQNPVIANAELINSGLYIAKATANGCTSKLDSILVVVNSVMFDSISILNSSNNICAGSSVTFTAKPINESSLAHYQWQLNGINVGSDNLTYTSIALNNGDKVTCILINNVACSISPTDTSNNIVMIVKPKLSPSVNISNSANNICSGTSVTFTALPANGGTTPYYQWKLNGNKVGINSISYANSNLKDNDVVTCTMTSSEECVTIATVASNSITVHVIPIAHPSLTIAPDNIEICQGNSVTFTVVPENGGNSPLYQWQINGISAGNNNVSFKTSTLKNNDVVSCVMTGSLSCSSPVSSDNTITMIIDPLPVVSLGPDITITPGNSVQLKPSITGNINNYLWTPPTALDNPNIEDPIASPLTTTLYKLTVTSVDGCESNGSTTVKVTDNTFGIPNAFTPNGDGLNDVFYILGTRNVKIVKDFSIYNRWGEKVFEMSNIPSNNPVYGWNGSYKGEPSPIGIYVYQTTIIQTDGTQKFYKGTVALIR